MSRTPVVYIGPEVGATAFRLAGAQAIEPAPGAELAALDQARLHASLVLVCASVARHIPPERWSEAVAAATPLVLVLSDLQGQVPAPDRVTPLRRQLGLVA